MYLWKQHWCTALGIWEINPRKEKEQEEKWRITFRREYKRSLRLLQNIDQGGAYLKHSKEEKMKLFEAESKNKTKKHKTQVY